MFEREHHVRVATVLQALNADLLASRGCLFGGGTAIVLANGEYRESVDIDFLVSNLDSYRRLRLDLTGPGGLQTIVREGATLNPARDLRADQYGVRTMVLVGTVEIKFEIVFESRISLEAPGPKDCICGVRTLTRLDMATSKLLANSDRWADDSVFSRDLIDLAMLAAPKKLREKALEKAREAYGEAIERDLTRSIDRLHQRAGRLDECMTALSMQSVPKAQLWSRIRKWRPAPP